MTQQSERYQEVQACYECDGNDHNCDRFKTLTRRMNCFNWYVVNREVQKIESGQVEGLSMPELIQIHEVEGWAE